MGKNEKVDTETVEFHLDIVGGCVRGVVVCVCVCYLVKVVLILK